MKTAHHILEDTLTKPPFTSIHGVPKLKNRLASEIKFMNGLIAKGRPVEKKFIETTNVTHFEDIVKEILNFENVTALLHTFAIKNPEDNTTSKHTVDFVAKGGDQWVKVISRSAKGVCMDWLSGNTRNIFEQAMDFIEMAERFTKNFCAPEVVFKFVAGCPDKIARKLTAMGVTVIGELIDIETITRIPEDFLEMLEFDEEEDEDEDEEEKNCDVATENNDPSVSNSLPPVNLDVSAVFVMVSNLTFPGGTDHRFNSKLLTQQAQMERKTQARIALENEIAGRKLIMCRTAYDSVHSIIETVGGKEEKKRWEELLSRVQIVEDTLSERTFLLKKSDRINERSMKIFGSGDFYKAVTATANKHFVSSAYHQGVAFNVLLHESRALSEQKEISIE